MAISPGNIKYDVAINAYTAYLYFMTRLLDIKESLVKLDRKDQLRTIAQFHRDKKVVPLEEFVESAQAFDRTFYETKTNYKEAKASCISFFKRVEGLGLGAYRLGRRTRPTRLIWRVDPSELLERAAELDVEVKAILHSDVPKSSPERLDDWGLPVAATAEKSRAVAAPLDAPLPAPTAMLTHSDIAPDVRSVLREASKGKGRRPQWMTAYQILERLPRRDQLVSERGMPGKNAGVHHAAASVVRDAILRDLKDEVEVAYFDNVGVLFEIAGTPVRGGFPVCGIYRLSDEASAEV